MTAQLATVDQLAVRLGRTLEPGTPDRARAESALADVSARARSIAEQPWADLGQVPDAVVTVVLAAARRIFTNPDRYLSNMAGTFQATMVNGDFNGDIFLPGELLELRKHQPTPNVRTIGFYSELEVAEHYPIPDMFKGFFNVP